MDCNSFFTELKWKVKEYFACVKERMDAWNFRFPLYTKTGLYWIKILNEFKCGAKSKDLSPLLSAKDLICYSNIYPCLVFSSFFCLNCWKPIVVPSSPPSSQKILASVVLQLSKYSGTPSPLSTLCWSGAPWGQRLCLNLYCAPSVNTRHWHSSYQLNVLFVLLSFCLWHLSDTLYHSW